jgi:hypothetical protein
MRRAPDNIDIDLSLTPPRRLRACGKERIAYILTPNDGPAGAASLVSPCAAFALW